MIFVTVGTHEQPFDRLLEEIDRLVATEAIEPDVFCQTGYSTYVPRVPSAPMVTYAEMESYFAGADVVVAHGGPGSIMPVLARNRPLVLVPRQHAHGEHVDDHQVAFCRRIGAERGVPVVEEIGDLADALFWARATEEVAPAATGGDVAIGVIERHVASLVRGRPALPHHPI